MTTTLIVAGCVAASVLVPLVFTLGFQVGANKQRRERLADVQAEAALAERRIHDLTLNAFMAMSETAERRRSRPLTNERR